MNSQTANLDYCWIVAVLRRLVENGICNEREAKMAAKRVANDLGADIIFPL